MLRAKGIYKNYGQLSILKGIDLEISKGEFLCIMGASGAGKSTLLHILGTLDLPDQGQLEIHGKAVKSYSSRGLAELRNRSIGFVFQYHHLLSEFTALENVQMPALIAGSTASTSKGRAMELLGKLGLSARADHRPAELSGGEQQRVALARALMNQPSMLLADEPTGNLDQTRSRELHQLLVDLARESGVTLVVVTHNPELASMADRVAHIKDGRLE